jgi:polar amino acid transport system substrate-binding protein
MKNLLILLFCFYFTNISRATESTIIVQYRNKPPYSYTKDNKPAGFLMDRTIKIFKLAKINAKYEEVPVKRIIDDIQKNNTPICSPSWYKLPEREEFAQFTLAIHQDDPHIILANVQIKDKIQKIKTLKDLVNTSDLQLGKVSGVSYGPELDAMISKAAQIPMDSTTTPLTLVKMINAKRADYMLIDAEDYKFIKENNSEDIKNLITISFPDMPKGLKRYIMCSKIVDKKIINNLNNAIKKIVHN